MANKKSFLDTAYLLLYGELPNKSQLEDFILEMKKCSFVN
jgi:citrate synthase